MAWMKLVVQIILVSGYLVPVRSFSTGAGACGSGEAPVGGFHSNTDNNRTVVGGRSLEKGEIVVELGGIPLTTNETIDFASGIDYEIEVESQEFVFRGALIRMEASGDVNTTFSLTPGLLMQEANACDSQPGNVVGVTHTENSDKQTLNSTIRFDGEVTQVVLDITVVFINSEEGSAYVYSQFLVNFVGSEEETVAPTSPPASVLTGGPTMQPTAGPTKLPTSGPTIQPTARPTDLPTAGPTMHPTAGPTNLPTSGTTTQPTTRPTIQGIRPATNQATSPPVIQPTSPPTLQFSTPPTIRPTAQATSETTMAPTEEPSGFPTVDVTGAPISDLTTFPTISKRGVPSTELPTLELTISDSEDSTENGDSDDTETLIAKPTSVPTPFPSFSVTMSPTEISMEDKSNPSASDVDPTMMPSNQPGNKDDHLIPTGEAVPDVPSLRSPQPPLSTYSISSSDKSKSTSTKRTKSSSDAGSWMAETAGSSSGAVSMAKASKSSSAASSMSSSAASSMAKAAKSSSVASSLAETESSSSAASLNSKVANLSSAESSKSKMASSSKAASSKLKSASDKSRRKHSSKGKGKKLKSVKKERQKEAKVVGRLMEKRR